MDYPTLKHLKTSEFEDAARGYQAASDMASSAKDAIEQRIAVKMRQSLDGAAVTAAVEQLQKLAENFHYSQVECGVISTSLRALAADLQAAKKKLDAAVADAEAEKFTVENDGSVTYPAGGEKQDGKTPHGGTARGTTDKTAQGVNRQAAGFDPNPNYARAQAYADRIAAALKEATETDEKWAPKLRKLKADDDLTVSAKDWADVQKDTRSALKGAEHYLDDIKAPPKGNDPESNAKWWNGLSDDEKAAYVSMHPASVGALDGLPADVRDEANRAVLSEKQGQYQTQLDAILAREPAKYSYSGVHGARRVNTQWKEWNEEKERVAGRVHGMQAIQDRFDRTGERGLPEAYLLGFDPDGRGNGKVILANGNPDTADHTAIYVPGTTTDISTIGDDVGETPSDLHRSEYLWGESSKMAPGEKVSTITWMDYDAPDTIPEATSDSYARRGAPGLHEFLEGSRTAHEYATGSAGHTTVMGHSYGSTLIGDTAKISVKGGTSLPMDDVMVAGSPGMQAAKASDLNIDPKHMWAMGGNWDDWGVRKGGDLVGLGGDGNIPTDPEFGGNIMKSDAGSHGAFWDQGSTSLRNQAAVVTGKYDQVVHD
ncbi:alpha/beta hydrolase [Streptomyces niger]|uniref:alpha/beta hydrolase n=1 Tax=Streptomyces niger TaxID=66373 RepID=UPI000699BDC1|nr:alpha/beta hydrolase [Streptomyces niger]